MQGQAVVLRDLGRHEEAAGVYRRWLKRRPGDHAARLNAVHFFQAIEQPDLGLSIAREGADENPASGDAVAILGIALDGAGRKDEALATLARARGLYQTPQDRMRIDELIASIRERGETPEAPK
jgi:tetratricopeptide (TPR) repeat protein